MKCIICSAETKQLPRARYDDRYGYRGYFPLTECCSCGHISLLAEFSDTELADLYSTYYPRSALTIEDHHPHVEVSGFIAWLNGAMSAAFRWVPKNVRVLDIGCGFGETLGYHKKRGCEVFGVEADENIRRVADKYGYTVHIGLFDSKNFPHNSFDYVTMDQVMEHVQQPVKVLEGIARVLRPGGVAILSVPNAHGWGARLFGHRWIHWHAPYHMQFYSVRSINEAVSRSGLKIERTMTRTTSSWIHYQWIHLLTYPPEGSPSKFWAKNGTYTTSQKMAIRLLIMINSIGVNHILTRLFDFIGIGDNKIIFLK